MERRKLPRSVKDNTPVKQTVTTYVSSHVIYLECGS